MNKTISSVSDVIDCLHTTPDYSDDGFPIVRVEDIGKRTINWINCLKVDEKTCDYMNKKYTPKKGDIVITRVGSFGRMSYITEDVKFCLGQNISIIHPKVDSNFLYYYLNSPYAQKFIYGNSNGSSYKSLSLEQINKIPFNDENLDKEKIGRVLNAIDLKIENNNKIFSELEGLAKTIYDYWFLQFEFPNEEGKPYKTSGGKMVYNEELKREIPEGWEVGNLTNNPLCSTIKPGVEKFETKNYLPTANINGEEITDGDAVTYDNRESRANMQPTVNSVWFAKMKNSIKHITLPENASWFVEKYILSTGMEGLQCKKESLAYIHSLVYSDYFEIHKDVLSHGATQEGVNEEDLKNIKFAVPCQTVLMEFAKKVNPVLKMKMNLMRENQQLASLRDWLLPMLMNGQVSFKEKA